MADVKDEIRMRAQRFSGLTVAVVSQLGLSACAGWQRIEPTPSPAFDERQDVQVWSGTHAVELHGVVLDADTLRGVPSVDPLDCTTCGIAIARSQIDSVRIGSREASGIVLGLAPFLTLGIVVGVMNLSAAD